MRRHLSGCSALVNVAGYYRWWSREPSLFGRVNHVATRQLMELALEEAGVQKVRVMGGGATRGG